MTTEPTPKGGDEKCPNHADRVVCADGTTAPVHCPECYPRSTRPHPTAIRALSNKTGEGSGSDGDWQPIADAWKYGDAKLIVTDGQAVHGAAWWHPREQAWLDCDGIVPTLFQLLPEPPAASNKGGRDGE